MVLNPKMIQKYILPLFVWNQLFYMKNSHF